MVFSFKHQWPRMPDVFLSSWISPEQAEIFRGWTEVWFLLPKFGVIFNKMSNIMTRGG